MFKHTIIFAAIAGLVLALAPAAQAMEFVPVGDPGNTADTTGYGAVAYDYNIGKYEVTNTQYAEFLTAVVGAGADAYALYYGSMQITAAAGVYTATAGNENKPVLYACWYDAIRFANWMTAGATESGSYTITGGGANSGTVAIPDASQRAAWAGTEFHVLLPSEDEWYKAAYYKGGGTSAGYWDYPTGSDAAPTAEGPPGTDMTNGSANSNTVIDVTTDVGAYTAKPSESPYGTYDQGGNLAEWGDTVIGANRVCRGGDYRHPVIEMRSSARYAPEPTKHDYDIGFRVSEVIPEPATLALVAIGGIGILMRRRGLRG